MSSVNFVSTDERHTEKSITDMEALFRDFEREFSKCERIEKDLEHYEERFNKAAQAWVNRTFGTPVSVVARIEKDVHELEYSRRKAREERKVQYSTVRGLHRVIFKTLLSHPRQDYQISQELLSIYDTACAARRGNSFHRCTNGLGLFALVPLALLAFKCSLFYLLSLLPMAIVWLYVQRQVEMKRDPKILDGMLIDYVRRESRGWVSVREITPGQCTDLEKGSTTARDGLYVKENDRHSNGAAQASQRAEVVAMAAAMVASLALTATYMVAERVAPVVEKVGKLVAYLAMTIAVLAAGVTGAAALSAVKACSLGMPLLTEKAAIAKKVAKTAMMTPLGVPVRAEVAACVVWGLAVMAEFGAGIPWWAQTLIAAFVGALVAGLVEWLVEWRMPAETRQATPASEKVGKLAKAAVIAALVASGFAVGIAEYKAGMARAGLANLNPVWLKVGAVTMVAGKAALAAVRASAVAREATTWKANGA